MTTISDRSLAAGANGPGFDFPIAQHVQRVTSQAFTYGEIGSLVSSWIWARQSWFVPFSIELVLGPSTWVHFIFLPLESLV